MLKGNVRTRICPANLDHLRVEWRVTDHKQITPFEWGYWFVVQGRTLLITLVWFEGSLVRPTEFS